MNLSRSISRLAVGGALGLTILAAQTPASYTGTVGDTMCGVKHSMGDNPVDCTRMCADGVDGYALVVGEKAYALKGVTKPEAAVLYKYAGKKVVVAGTLKGTDLNVRSVAPAATK